MTKIYNAAGVSRVRADQPFKLRMATDIEWRRFDLARGQHVDVTLINLPEAMDKVQAVQFLQTAPEFADNAEAQAVFVDYLTTKGVIERPKKKRGRPAKARVEDAAAAETTETAAADGLTDELTDAAAETPVVQEALAATEDTPEFEPEH
jgi:hypothetical protein